MFTVTCPGHRARVLLGPRSIDRLVTTEDGVHVHWHCHCGAHGVVDRHGRAVPARVEHAA
jgi:hypothetical protein